MATNDTYLYPYSAEEASRRNELQLWRESFRANIACKEAIEAAIRRDFDGWRLKNDCAKSVIAEYGFKRVEFVLSNTLQVLKEDGRFSRGNKEWSKRTFVPPGRDHNYQFSVSSHPAVLDGFVDEYREAVRELKMFDYTHCVPDSSEQDYTGKVLVLSPQTLREECWKPEDQLWLALDGFGCGPKAIGRSIRSVCLSDGEETRWNRHDFIGILKDEHLPDWAMENLPRYRNQEETPMGGIEMK